jgi:hypothetical protein
MQYTPRPVSLVPLSLLLFYPVRQSNAQSKPPQPNPLRKIAEQLRLAETSQDSWPSTDVPLFAQQLLPQRKAAPPDLTQQSVNAHPVASPENLRTFRLADLSTAGLEVM